MKHVHGDEDEDEWGWGAVTTDQWAVTQRDAHEQTLGASELASPVSIFIMLPNSHLGTESYD